MLIRTTANCLRCVADFVIAIVTIVVYHFRNDFSPCVGVFQAQYFKVQSSPCFFFADHPLLPCPFHSSVMLLTSVVLFKFR